jgi:AcrR family transcriptional regulator
MSTEEAVQALPRKERERLAHRREILEAAERVFARNGYHMATVEEIAQEAEFAVGTLYNFFKSKEELYEQVLMGIVDEFMADFRERVLTIEDPAEAIGATIELRLRLFEKHRSFARVVIEALPGGHVDHSMVLPKSCDAAYEEGMRAVTGIFERGVRSGAFIEVEPLYLTLALAGIMSAFLAYWARCEPSEPLGDRVEKIKKLFLAWIRRDKC